MKKKLHSIKLLNSTFIYLNTEYKSSPTVYYIPFYCILFS